MSEPVILINGRRLLDAQVQALCVAISSFIGTEPPPERVAGYHDRLAEVQAMLKRHASDEMRKASPQLGQRSARILQLAGIVPERASEEERQIADEYAVRGVPIDMAAAALFRRR